MHDSQTLADILDEANEEDEEVWADSAHRNGLIECFLASEPDLMNGV